MIPVAPACADCEGPVSAGAIRCGPCHLASRQPAGMRLPEVVATPMHVRLVASALRRGPGTPSELYRRAGVARFGCHGVQDALERLVGEGRARALAGGRYAYIPEGRRSPEERILARLPARTFEVAEALEMSVTAATRKLWAMAARGSVERVGIAGGNAIWRRPGAGAPGARLETPKPRRRRKRASRVATPLDPRAQVLLGALASGGAMDGPELARALGWREQTVYRVARRLVARRKLTVSRHGRYTLRAGTRRAA